MMEIADNLEYMNAVEAGGRSGRREGLFHRMGALVKNFTLTPFNNKLNRFQASYLVN